MTSIMGDDGDEVAIYEYDGFGNVLTEAGSLSNEFKFSTKQADRRGQLIDFGFRWYDPEVGRWTQRDPLGVAGGLNLYAYCNGDPVNQVDPLGLFHADAPFNPDWDLENLTPGNYYPRLFDPDEGKMEPDPRDWGGEYEDEPERDKEKEERDTSMGSPWEEFWKGMAQGAGNVVSGLPFVPDSVGQSLYNALGYNDELPEIGVSSTLGTVAGESLLTALGMRLQQVTKLHHFRKSLGKDGGLAGYFTRTSRITGRTVKVWQEVRHYKTLELLHGHVKLVRFLPM